MILYRFLALSWIIAVVSAWSLTENSGSAEDWPQFRGPAESGIITEKDLPSSWAKDKNIAWKISVPGVAWASPIVWKNKIYLITAISDKQKKPTPFSYGGMGGKKGGGDKNNFSKDGKEGKGGFGKGDFSKDKEGKGGYGKGGSGKGGFGKGGKGGFGSQKAPDAQYTWQLIALDLATGNELWKSKLLERKPAIPIFPSNSYASETPATDGERIYTYIGMHGIFCTDMTGKMIWKKELEAYKMMGGFGTGSSPIIDDKHIYVICDNEEKSFILALDKKSGEQVWKKERKIGSSWSSPFIWKNAIRTELVACGKSVVSYDPKTGETLWEMNGIDSGFSSTPVGNEQMIYFGTNGPMSRGPLFAVKAGAKGDISLKEGEKSNEFIAWSRDRSGPGIASMLLVDSYLFVSGQARVSCYNAATGKEYYQNERLEGAGGITASPWTYGGKVFFLDENGATFAVNIGSTFEVESPSKLTGMFWASPAVSSGSLLIRSSDELYCIRSK